MPGRAVRYSIACAVVALTGIAACSNNHVSGGSGAEPSSVPEAKVAGDLALGHPSPALCNGKKYTIGYDSFSDTQDYAKSVLKNLQQAAAATGCVTVVPLTDNADAATALANVNTLIQRKVDGVVLFQIVASAQAGICSRLKAAGIPVVTHAVPAPCGSFVSPSDSQSGQTGGKALAAAAKARFPGKTPYIVLGADPATGAVSNNRVGGVRDAILSQIQVPAGHIIEISTQSKPDIAFDQMTNVIARIPAGSPVLISGINDDVVGGMFRALDQAGRAADTLAAGMGGLYPSGVSNVCQHSQFVGTVDFQPETAGNYLIPALLDEIAGKKVPVSVTMPVKLLTKQDVPAKYPTFKC